MNVNLYCLSTLAKQFVMIFALCKVKPDCAEDVSVSVCLNVV